MSKALLIVEGGRLEPRFFERMSKVCNLGLEIVSLRANIYRLYQKLKEYGFDYDVRVALRELIKDEETLAKLNDTYAYTYLIFDCDAHHAGIPKKGEVLPDIGEIVRENYGRIAEMIDYFTDETDPDRGRLFINYPMMESYRDCDSYDDVEFATRVVRLEDLNHYKEIVGCRKMASRRIDELEVSDFSAMLRMQFVKAEQLKGAGQGAMSGVRAYNDGIQNEILTAQHDLLPSRVMSVLNTSLFLLLDYEGGFDLEL